MFRELDELERRADERDRVADERDRHADERERLADDRERAADERTRIADECEARLQEDRALGSTGPRHQSREALRQANDALERAQARAWAGRRAVDRQATQKRPTAEE